jgi:predicted ATPase
LKQVANQPEDKLYRLLSRLQTAEFIYEQPVFPEPEYVFKHALTQEVTYPSLLHERRKTLHERVAQAVEAQFHARLEDRYSELAHYDSRSGNTPKAIDYLHRAGQQAVERSSNVEAVKHFNEALELLKLLPDTPQRAQQEPMMQTSLGSLFMATAGFAMELAWATGLQGWTLRSRGAEKKECQGMAAWQAPGAEIFHAWWLALMANGYRAEGRTGEDLSALTETFTRIEQTEDCFYESELYRLKGELTLQKGARD